MTLNSVEIATDARREYKPIFNIPSSIDVVGQTGLPGGAFGRGIVRFDEYKAIRLTLSDTGRYTGTDPCTGDSVADAEIQLPESEGGKVIINYMVPHPVLGLQTGFRLMQSMKVGFTPIDLHLTFSASNSVVCASSAGPLRSISGDSTQMAKPLGVALYRDPAISAPDEIAVVNGAPNRNRITFYQRTGDGNLSPLRLPLEGEATGLSSPIGIYLDTDHDEIGVANSGNNSITIYNRTDSGNSPPRYSLMGDQTGLNGPDMVAFYSDQLDHNNDEILVANSGNNSITIYKWYDVISNGNAAPLHTIGRDFVITDVNNANNVIDLTESGVVGNCTPSCNVTIPVNSYRTGTELAAALETRLNTAVTSGTSFTVRYDDTTGLFTITVTALGIGVSSVTLNWGASTSAGVLGFNPLSSGPLYLGSSATSDFGDITGLNAPCGIYVDTANNEIGVANNGNNSITIYDRDQVINSITPNITPKRTIRGQKTDLSAPCGIALYLDQSIPSDPTKDEIIVANTGDNSVKFYSRIANGNVPPVHPLRSIKGNATGISGPVGIYMDTANNEIGVTNSSHNSLTIHKRYDNTVQLKRLPVLIQTAQQQTLFSQFSYSGEIDTPVPLPPTISPSKPISLDGYRFVWKITDQRIRQKGDASSALLLPPRNIVFELSDGTILSNLPVECPQLTPFIILQLSTNCPPSPLIRSPLPVTEGDYRIASILFAAITVTRFPLTPTPLEESEFPRPLPTLKLFTDGTIDEIDWKYVNEAGVDLPSPLIFSQQIQIYLTQSYASVSSCYKQVSGNTPKLVFDSGSLLPNVPSLKEVKNNQCGISLNYVESIVFSITDALSNNFVFTWKII